MALRHAAGFNLDHVVIGRESLFAVETKVWSKPHRGESRTAFDGWEIDWFIERAPGSGREIWVLNPWALPKFLEREEAYVLHAGDVT